MAVAAPGLGLPSTSNSSITNSPKEVIDQVWQIVYRDFLDSTGKYSADSWTRLRKDLLSKSYAGPDESYEAIRGMLASLDDPYTRFLDPKEFKEMQIDTSGELTGVGIQITLDKDTKEIVVVSPIEGTPASRAGVQPKDVIVSVDGRSTKGMTTADAVKLIRGQEGTEVILGLRRKGEVVSVPLKRARIEIQAVDSRLNTTKNGQKIGYIRLKQFNANASREMRRRSASSKPKVLRAMCSTCAATQADCWKPASILRASGSTKAPSSAPKLAMAFRMCVGPRAVH